MLSDLNLKTIGHGYYLLWRDGDVHSHSDSSINKTAKGLKFGKGDVLEFDYIPLQEKLTVVKRGSQERFEFKVK